MMPSVPRPHQNRRRPTTYFAIEAQRQLSSGNAEQAIETCRNGLIFYPEHITGYIVLANAFQRIAQPERALNVLKDAFRRTGNRRLDELASELETTGELRPRTFDLPQPEGPSLFQAHSPASAGGASAFVPREHSVEHPDHADAVTEEARAEDTPGDHGAASEVVGPSGAGLRIDDQGSAVEEPIEEAVDESLEETTAQEPSIPEPSIPEATTAEPIEDSDDAIDGDERIEDVFTEPEEAHVVEVAIAAESDVGGDVVVVAAATRTSVRRRSIALALHTGQNVTRLRSANLRLIPGLEFAPLRHEEPARRQPIAPLIDEPIPAFHPPRRPTGGLDAPPMPTFGGPTEETVSREDDQAAAHRPEAAGTESHTWGAEEEEPLLSVSLPEEPFDLESFTLAPERPFPPSSHEMTPLEELARRLERARIPAVEDSEPRQAAAFEPSIVSDTFAGILVQQGAYAEAIKAYQTLARTRPDRYEFYQQKILEMQRLMENS